MSDVYKPIADALKVDRHRAKGVGYGMIYGRKITMDIIDDPIQNKPKSRRGFASMSPEKRLEIAAKGGHAAHAKGTAHRFTAAEARAAGKKGGAAVSMNREYMAEIGKRGGINRSRNQKLRTSGNLTQEELNDNIIGTRGG